MVIAYQGFAIKKSLEENLQDRNALNNLGGTPIADDIALFFNNKRNVSSVEVTSSNISGNSVIIPNAQSIFSNDTKLSINGLTYYVKNSNGVDQFQLSDNPNVAVTSLVTPPVGTYIRSDEITLQNITNFSKLRRSTDFNRAEEDTRLSYLNQNRTILGSDTGINVLKRVESNLDFYRYKTTKALVSNKTFVGKKLLKVDGTVFIKDPDNRNVEAGALENSTYPGLFIRDPITGNNVRAFSTNEQPWEAIPNKISPQYLQTTSTQMTIGNLYFNNSTQSLGIDLTIKNNSNFLTTISPAVGITAFTHTVPMTVNGETYYLCLKLGS